MRIGITTHNYPPHLGGLETIVRELVRGFSRQHEVTVVSTAWQGRVGVNAEDGATVYRLPAWHGAERAGVPYAVPLGPLMPRAMRALRGCDVLHAHGSLYPTTLMALLARRKSVPFFVTEHVGVVAYPSPVLNGVQDLAWAAIGTPVVRRASRVITYNSRVRDALASRFGADRIVFIGNGVDTAAFTPSCGEARRAARARFGLPSDTVLALFVGRDAGKKNLSAVLTFPFQHYQLVVCGAERSLPGHVSNLGALPHESMPQVFAAVDFVLHAATGEGFPVAIQEGMASGLPVAVLWDEGYSGSVSRDAVMAVASMEELATTAERLALNPNLRAEYSRRSREFALSHWKWETTVERHLDLFHRASGSAA
jgi:rhamnosyl/mannosyltransferase